MASLRGTLFAAILGSGIVFLDTTVVNVALPRIGTDLPATVVGVLEGQAYVYNGYLLSLSALLILAGALADFYGRRRTFVVGLAGFGVTSVLCGLAPTMEWLVAFRVLQGAAGALLVPGSLALITAAFGGEAQGRAFGLWAGASGATTILGPLVGGILVDVVSWRAAFLINAPLVAVGLWVTLRAVEESRDESATGAFDWPGAAVVAIAVGGLAFGGIYGQQREWRDPLAFAALAAGAGAAVAFPFLAARSQHPLVPLHLFRSRNFTVTNVSTLVIYGALYVTFYYVPLFMQGTLGYTAAAAGLAGIPSTLLLVFFSSRFGALAGRHGPRRFMAAGPALMALGVAWMLRVPAASAAWGFQPGNPATLIPPASYLIDFLPAYLVYGIGLTIMVAPLTTCLMTSVPVRNSGVASAINNAISRIGPQLAGAAIFVAVTAGFYADLAARIPGLDVSAADVRARIAPLNRPAPDLPADQVAAARDASTRAFRTAMLISVALLAAGAAINAVWITDPPRAGSGTGSSGTAPG
ncbi:MAG: MFS transporter [Armatimonadota bacterium]|nr:MFS transporter [Armatimonadota bacterium]